MLQESTSLSCVYFKYTQTEDTENVHDINLLFVVLNIKV